MKLPLLHTMQAALGATQSGRLQDATAMIQRALMPQNPNVGATTPAPAAANVIDGEVIKTDIAPSPVTQTSPVPDWRDGLAKLQAQFEQWQRPEILGEHSAVPTNLPPLPEGAQFVAKNYQDEHGSLAYYLYIPSHYQPNMPLVVMLHGCTQSAVDFAIGTDMNRFAETHGCLVAYPNQNAHANQRRCWNWFQPQDQRRDQGEPALIANLTRSIVREYAIDERKVYVAGLSAGGAMAAIMGTTYPDLYAAVGVHSGLASGSAHDLLSALAAMRQGAKSSALDQTATQRFVPTMVIHGDHDTTVTALNGQQVFSQAKQRLASNDEFFNVEQQQYQPSGQRAYTRTCLKDAKGNVQVEHWLIHGAGHAWAGGNANGSYTDPQAPNASQALLDFFLNHARD